MKSMKKIVTLALVLMLAGSLMLCASAEASYDSKTKTLTVSGVADYGKVELYRYPQQEIFTATATGGFWGYSDISIGTRYLLKDTGCLFNHTSAPPGTSYTQYDDNKRAVSLPLKNGRTVSAIKQVEDAVEYTDNLYKFGDTYVNSNLDWVYFDENTLKYSWATGTERLTEDDFGEYETPFFEIFCGHYYDEYSYPPGYPPVFVATRRYYNSYVPYGSNLTYLLDFVDVYRSHTTAQLDYIKKTMKTKVTGVQTLKLSGVTSQNLTLDFGSKNVVIDGGHYTGAPAVKGSNLTVRRGTIVDDSGTTSNFLVDPDSEATVTTSGDKTVTTVKLSNPPLVVDWNQSELDLAPPSISIVRTPASPNEPTTSVSLTITVVDGEGNDSDTPISINGGTFVASPYTLTVTENQTVTITGRDAFGNFRDVNVVINNIDKAPPTIFGLKPSTLEPTNTGVTITVDAADDTQLSSTPYNYYFYNTTGTLVASSTNTSAKSYTVTQNGTLEVTVKDYLGKTATERIQIKNIDKLAPSVEIKQSVASGQIVTPQEGVTVTVTPVNKSASDAEMPSPLPELFLQWNDKDYWTSETTRTFNANGTYQVRIRDSAGNVSSWTPVTISAISTGKPVITSYTGTHLSATYVIPPVTLTVEAIPSASAPLADKPYSWDGGQTWVTSNRKTVYANGEYPVMVRDKAGAIVSATLIVDNIDVMAPTANVYLYKGLPEGVTEGGPENYVWKIKVDADDIGSGIDHIETLWNGGTYTGLPIVWDVAEPGVYGVVVYDKAGNSTYAEKVVSAEAVGLSSKVGSDMYVEVKPAPSGTAGPHFNASLSDLVFSNTGAYNKDTKAFTTYPAGAVGIPVHLTVGAKSGKFVTGYATFNSVKYPVSFGGDTIAAGAPNMDATVFIPYSNITSDIRNGRIVVVIQEWADASKSALEREGSLTLYTSVQVSDPRITYTYNKALNELTVVATSSVAGIASTTYDIGSGSVNYTGPFSLGAATSVTITARDNTQRTTTLTLPVSSLEVSGSGGGALPTEGLTADNLNSYYISSRFSEAYILGGTRSNTNNVPASNVISTILGS